MIAAGDFHLGLISDSVLVDGIPSRLADTKIRLMEAMDLAAGEEDKTLVIVGDLFHRVLLDPMTVEAVLQAFHYAEQLSLRVIVIPGNHDCDVKWSATTLTKEIRRSNLITIHEPELVIRQKQELGFFLPHMPRSREMSFLKKHGSYKKYLDTLVLMSRLKKHVLFGHAHVRGATNAYGVDISGYGSGTAMEFVPKEFPSYFSVVILGHIHRHQVIHSGKGYDIIFTGPAVATNFGEADLETGCVRLNLKNHIHEWEFVPYKSKVHEYKHVKINLLERKGVPNLDEEKIKRTLSGKLLKITVFARSAFQVDEAGLKSVFNKYATVMRMEYKIESQRSASVRGEQGKETVPIDSLNHMNLFKTFVKKADASVEVKERALEVGREVIKECCAE
jgi:DNA repair exonuclease SbcCD nuclease subunit